MYFIWLFAECYISVRCSRSVRESATCRQLNPLFSHTEPFMARQYCLRPRISVVKGNNTAGVSRSVSLSSCTTACASKAVECSAASWNAACRVDSCGHSNLCRLKHSFRLGSLPPFKKSTLPAPSFCPFTHRNSSNSSHGRGTPSAASAAWSSSTVTPDCSAVELSGPKKEVNVRIIRRKRHRVRMRAVKYFHPRKSNGCWPAACERRNHSRLQPIRWHCCNQNVPISGVPVSVPQSFLFADANLTASRQEPVAAVAL